MMSVCAQMDMVEVKDKCAHSKGCGGGRGQAFALG